MTYLLDTNIVSEFATETPESLVVNWLQIHQHMPMFLSVVTIGEVQQGITRLPASQKQEQLTVWLEEMLLPAYQEYILPLDTGTMRQWGMLTGKLMQRGRKLPVMDGLIAATAIHHNLALVTRNTTDFTGLGVVLVNPWLEM
ncbi:MAG: type II toxin-antitoxin system VapC family toxin [Chloroflexi bacterium]|nr:type II toxin-antitoxin system VapC family toxin [Chloroflexota bacterium]